MKEIGPDELKSLVAAAKNGDQSAFAQLHDTYMGPLYRFAVAQVRDKASAEDIVQAVFLKSWRALPTYEERGHPFSAWLYQIARNEIIDRARQPAAASLEDMSENAHPEARDTASDPLQVATRSELFRAILAGMQSLSEEQRTVVTLRFMEDRPIAEIAALLSKSEVNIRQIQCRALKSLRDKISYSA